MKTIKILFLVLVSIIFTSCGGSGSSNTDLVVSGADYSGTYYVTLSDPRYQLTIVQSGSSFTWSMGTSPTNVLFSGAGTVSGTTLTGSTSTPSNFSISLSFSGKTEFSGTWIATGPLPTDSSNGTITGSKTSWPTYNFDNLGIPKFVTNNYIELSKIDHISLFRSSEGHDYSDDFESCRSMKHYYIPKTAINPASIVISSPVNGTVIGYSQEWAGYQVGIRSSAYPGIVFILFHVNLTTPLNVGDTVAAGQTLGTHIGSQTVSDIAVGIATPSGYRLVSFLDTLSSGLFADYVNRGMSAPSDGILSKAARDADPLTCNGEQFTSTGSLPHIFQFN